MHCDGCVSTILKSVRSFEGVESVEAEATSNKLTVTGKVDPLKIRDYLNHKTKKKVELISPQPQKQDTSKNNNNKEDKKSNDKKPDTDAKPKEAPVITAVLKLEFHCQGCIEKIDKIVHKTKGVHERVLDKQKELVTVKGTMDVKALAETLKSRLKRAVDIVPPKKEKEKEKEKEGGKDGENAAGGGGGKKKGGGGNGGQDAAAAAAATKIEENRMEYMVQPGFGPGYGYVGQPIHGYGYMGQPIHGNGYVGQPVYAPYGPDYRYGYGYGHGPVQGYPDHLQFNDENPNACSIFLGDALPPRCGQAIHAGGLESRKNKWRLIMRPQNGRKIPEKNCVFMEHEPKNRFLAPAIGGGWQGSHASQPAISIAEELSLEPQARALPIGASQPWKKGSLEYCKEHLPEQLHTPKVDSLPCMPRVCTRSSKSEGGGRAISVPPPVLNGAVNTQNLLCFYFEMWG
ncbi:hypothetical protein OIU76_030469 [Salix suchowensis]|nr:hypothetical protein OIU76_030469 [Salix suchowensis]